jgi:AraC family transcriptional regulator
MTLARAILGQGRGWRVSQVNCDAGPDDPLMEEQHGDVCMAVVLGGTFGYRTPQGLATLAPGAVLLGNSGDCFACGHEHSAGDRCLAFHLEPGFYEDVVSSTPGATRLRFSAPCLPPTQAMAKLTVVAEAAGTDAEALEEIAVELAGTIAHLTAGSPSLRGSRDARSLRRIEETVRRIDEDVDRPLPLNLLAREAAMSPFHFLREFRDQVGVTPHQYVLGRRLRRAALRLRQTNASVLSIALDCGFNDVSEFNRRFRRVMGVSPTAFRVAGRRRSRRGLG